jgi:hypothetical protein
MVKIKTIFMFVYVEFVSFLFAFMPPKLLRIVTRDRVTTFENNAFQQAEKRPLSTNVLFILVCVKWFMNGTLKPYLHNYFYLIKSFATLYILKNQMSSLSVKIIFNNNSFG